MAVLVFLMTAFVLTMTLFFKNMTVIILIMIGMVLKITEFFLNVTGSVPQLDLFDMTGFVKNILK